MKKNLQKKCKLEECDRPGNVIKGYCPSHYSLFQRKGWVTFNTRLTPNTYRQEGDITYIGLRNNQGVIASEAIIDTEDVPRVKATKWYRKDGKYVYGLLNGKRRYLHRIVMETPSNQVVNHWNHNLLDCRKQNLVNCTQAENLLYTRKSKGKYPYKGVQFRNDCVKKWRVRLNAFKTRIDMGGYDTIEEAAYVYDQVVMQIAGDFAYTNFKWDK